MANWTESVAMLLSNRLSSNRHNNVIAEVGARLSRAGAHGEAQFCFLLAGVPFDKRGNRGAHLVLVGADHRRVSGRAFLTPEAIQMTAIYEHTQVGAHVVLRSCVRACVRARLCLQLWLSPREPPFFLLCR